jgi:hypothetical protein
MFVTQCRETVTHEIHFVQKQWLTGETFGMKTQNPYSTVILIQTSMLKTQESDNDEDYVEEEQPSPPVQWKQIKKSGLRSQADQTYVHQFTGSDTGKKQNKAPYINKDSSPLNGLMLYFTSVMYVLVTKTNRY